MIWVGFFFAAGALVIFAVGFASFAIAMVRWFMDEAEGRYVDWGDDGFND